MKSMANEMQKYDGYYLPEFSTEERAASLTDDEFIQEHQMNYEATPDKCDSQKVLQAPKLQSMTAYLKFHYTRTIRTKLFRWIDELGEGGIWIGSDFPVACRDTAKITGIDFWWASRIGLIADVMISVDVIYPGMNQIRHQRYIVSMYFDFEKGIRLVDTDIIKSGDFLDREGLFQLSQYLVPYLKKEMIEYYAQALLEKHFPKALEKLTQDAPKQLADRLGLNIIRLPLYECDKIRSILFFKKDSVQIAVKDYYRKMLRTRSVTIQPNTIVINETVTGKDAACALDIYHECIHYEWHYMFFKLQDMYNNDLRTIARKQNARIVRLEPDWAENNPLCWVEYQAKRGSFDLWMPEKAMQEKVREMLRNPELRGEHIGATYEHIAKQLSHDLLVPKYRVRARLIQLGHWYATGCLNYEDGQYVPPFSFIAEDNERNYTYFITRKQFCHLYQNNEKLREQVLTGKFVYVQGHLCLNRPEYVYQTDKGPEMTASALRRVDLCCLRFKTEYYHDSTYFYCHGRLNCDDDYNQKYFYFPPKTYNAKHPMPTIKEQIKRNKEYVKEMPRSFPKLLKQIMKDCNNIGVQELANKSTVSSRTIENYLSENYCFGYTLDKVLALAFALHLPPWVSEEFIKAAGFEVTSSPAMIEYKCALETMFMDPVIKINSFLGSMGKNLIGEKKVGELEYDA